MVTFAEAFKQAKSTDEELQKIAGFLTKLEQAIIVEYRKLLESGCGYASEHRHNHANRSSPEGNSGILQTRGVSRPY